MRRLGVKLPKDQLLWETIRDERGRVVWAICSDAMRSVYILYKVYGSELKKMKTAKSPAEFEKTVEVRI